MAKKPTPAPQSKEPPMNEALIRQDFQVLDAGRSLLQADVQEEAATVFEIGQRIGALQATHMWSQTFAAAKVRMFDEICALPKGSAPKIPVRQPDGTFAVAKDVVELCRLVFGTSYTSMFEAKQSLDALGEEIYSLAVRLGLNRNALRATRTLPPEKLEVVRAAIGNGSTKAEVLSVIEDLAEKVQQAEAATAEAMAEIKAGEEVLATKNKTIDKLQRDLKRIQKLPPDEQLAGLKKEATAIATEAEGFILGGLRQALLAINDHDASGDYAQHGTFMAGLVGQVQAQLTALREEFNLPDVSKAADQRLAAEMAEWDKE